LVLRLVLTLLTLSLICVSTPGFAQGEEDQERAVQLAEEGGEAFQNGDYALAAQKFAEAHSHYPDLSLKMNEMAAWYKARRCGEAIAVANYVTGTQQTLTEQDKSDLYKVHLECGYKEASEMLEAGDLDAADARLTDVRPIDPELASNVGELRGKIEERRKALAQQDNHDPDLSAETDAPGPPPQAAKWGGIAMIGLGAATLLTGVGKFLFVDQAAVRQWRKYYKDTYGCELDAHNNVNLQECSDPANASLDHKDLRDELDKANRANTIIYTTGGIATALGLGLYTYWVFRKNAYDQYQAEQSQARVILAPVIAPHFTGATFQLRF
jgi:outer membrane protein assembly factor BamD (BamD/ComL family)